METAHFASRQIESIWATFCAMLAFMLKSVTKSIPHGVVHRYNTLHRFLYFGVLTPLFLTCLLKIIFVLQNQNLANTLINDILVPYALFTGITLYWFRHKSNRAIRIAIYRLPMLLLAVQIGYFFICHLLNISSHLATLLAFSAMSVISPLIFAMLAYIYVLVIEQAYIFYIFQRNKRG